MPRRLVVAVLAAGVIVGLATPPRRLADASTYVLMADSLWSDGDLAYTPADFARAERMHFDDLPAGLFLIESGSSYRYAKPLLYPLLATPWFGALRAAGLHGVQRIPPRGAAAARGGHPRLADRMAARVDRVGDRLLVLGDAGVPALDRPVSARLRPGRRRRRGLPAGSDRSCARSSWRAPARCAFPTWCSPPLRPSLRVAAPLARALGKLALAAAAGGAPHPRRQRRRQRSLVALFRAAPILRERRALRGFRRCGGGGSEQRAATILGWRAPLLPRARDATPSICLFGRFAGLMPYFPTFWRVPCGAGAGTRRRPSGCSPSAAAV